jgi:hypothetical protein
LEAGKRKSTKTDENDVEIAANNFEFLANNFEIVVNDGKWNAVDENHVN